MTRRLVNPILPGYYPDPSICRNGEDFYLVCSSFEMDPGLPVFHSRDLAHWHQIGNAMTRENGFHMERNCGVGGLMAPTIRYHQGTYYIINTNLADKGNYIITASDPAGPWSEPHWMEDVPGIDASLFIDEDGQAYVIGIGNVWDNGTGVKERGIWIAKYNLEEFRLEGEPFTIFNSALRCAASPEAPHIYHVGEYYYLIIAEGGTEHYHAVMCARSKELFSFFEGDPANPVMTHRHMGFTCPIINVGHADLIDLPDGSWYAVMLASRLIDGKYKNLGRETFLCPVQWERGWPLFSPQTGKIQWEYEAPACLKEQKWDPEPERDDFESPTLPDHLVFWGTPRPDCYRLRDSYLELRCIPQRLDDDLRPMTMDDPRREDAYVAFVSRRQRGICATVKAKMEFFPQGKESAGIAVVQAMNHQLHVERAVEEGKQVVRVVLITSDFNQPPYFPGFTSTTHRTVIHQQEWEGKEIVLGVQMEGERFTVICGPREDQMVPLCQVDGALLNPEKVGCMCGTMLGVYATGNGTDSSNTAKFDWLSYREE